jgi:hypothetical protein
MTIAFKPNDPNAYDSTVTLTNGTSIIVMRSPTSTYTQLEDAARTSRKATLETVTNPSFDNGALHGGSFCRPWTWAPGIARRPRMPSAAIPRPAIQTEVRHLCPCGTSFRRLTEMSVGFKRGHVRENPPSSLWGSAWTGQNVENPSQHLSFI